MKIALNEVTTIPAGVALRLTPEQASARGHSLETMKKGVFVGTHALQFKAGEIVDVVGDLPKGILPVYDRALISAEVKVADQPVEVTVTNHPAEVEGDQ